MVEKLSPQNAENIKESPEELFLRQNLNRARDLAQNHALEKPPKNINSALDISSILKDKLSWNEIIPIIKQGGYTGINIGTDQIKSNEQAKEVKEKLNGYEVKTESFHGTTDPYFLNLSEKPDANSIKHDFEIAKTLDPEEIKPMNYDLAGGDLPEINKFQTGTPLQDIHKTQRKILTQKDINSEKDIIEQTIQHIARGRPNNSKRPITFEFYMSYVAESATVTEENIKHLIECAKENIGDDKLWGITIDVGHLFNHLIMNLQTEGAKNVKTKIDNVFTILEKYKDHIKMVHASGTVTANLFQASKALAQEKNIDYEAIRAWSMHQVIDNKLIIKMAERLRNIKGDQPYVEISEVRPIHSATKYFGDTLNFSKEESVLNYKEQIKLQADILGYSK